MKELIDPVVRIIEALAWPGTVLLIFMVLRKHIAHAAPYLEKLKYRDFELTFSKQLHEIVDQAKKSLPPSDKENESELISLQYWSDLIKLSPRAAVASAYRELEGAAVAAIFRHKLKLNSFFTVNDMSDMLTMAGILDKKKVMIFHRLAGLYNSTIHAGTGRDISLEDAAEYVALASRFREYLSKA
ncbi:MAG: hypothetical protein M0R70_15655 [Nitrospirae bacterium]|nr:hypothetical protein [Nitrospirota bacterium]